MKSLSLGECAQEGPRLPALIRQALVGGTAGHSESWGLQVSSWMKQMYLEVGEVSIEVPGTVESWIINHDVSQRWRAHTQRWLGIV